MPSVSRAVCVQRASGNNGRRCRDGAAAAGRRSVVAQRARHGKPEVAIRSGSGGSARGGHCSPLRAVAAPIPTTKKMHAFNIF
uniref:Uncharacterized protein n=3 Tax=Oryza TaxID=4527 RepID=A0A0D3G7H6_9ORYZ